MPNTVKPFLWANPNRPIDVSFRRKYYGFRLSKKYIDQGFAPALPIDLLTNPGFFHGEIKRSFDLEESLLCAIGYTVYVATTDNSLFVSTNHEYIEDCKRFWKEQGF